MDAWTLKAKLYRNFRNKFLWGRILKQEIENLRFLISKIPHKPRTILDLGCGDGNVTAVLSKSFPEAQITAVDFNYKMLKELKSRRNTYRVLGDALQLPLKNNAFELCTAVGLAEYIKDKHLFLYRLHELLSPSGYAVITYAPKNFLTFLRHSHGIKIYSDTDEAIEQYLSQSDFILAARSESIIQKQYLLKKK